MEVQAAQEQAGAGYPAEEQARPTAEQALMGGPRQSFPIGDRTLVVRPVVIRDILRVQEAIDGFGRRLAQVDPELDVTMDTLPVWLGRLLPLLWGTLADLLLSLYPELVQPYASLEPQAAREAAREYLEEHLEPADLVAIVLAFLAVNRLPEILGNVQRVRAMLPQLGG